MPIAARVLLVDEVDEDRDIYGIGLQYLGYEVTSSGYSGAAHTATRMRPDLIVLHIGPAPGWDTCDALLRSCRTIPVIALTAAVRADGANRARVRSFPNCAAFVGKPCSHEELAAVIRRVLGGERRIEATAGALLRGGSP